MLNNCYPADQLEPYSGSLPFTVDGWRKELTVSLHEATRKQAPWNAFTANACHCHSGCGTNKCGCRRTVLAAAVTATVGNLVPTSPSSEWLSRFQSLGCPDGYKGNLIEVLQSHVTYMYVCRRIYMIYYTEVCSR